MSFSLISNARQMFTENLYMVTEELCHMSPSEMVDAGKSLLNTVKGIVLKPDLNGTQSVLNNVKAVFNSINGVSLKADALIQALFEKKIRDQIVKTSKEVCEPVCEIIKGAPKHRLTRFCASSIILTSCAGSFFEQESMFIYAGMGFVAVQTIFSIAADIIARLDVELVDIGKDQLKDFAKSCRIGVLTCCMAAFNANLIAPSNIEPTKTALFFQNFVYSTIYCLTMPIPGIIRNEMPFHLFKDLEPNLRGTFTENVKNLHRYIKYKEIEKVLKEIDLRSVPSFEYNVANLVHEYVGIKEKALTPLHVKLINYVNTKSKIGLSKN